jgi:hypothetical protein
MIFENFYSSYYSYFFWHTLRCRWCDSHAFRKVKKRTQTNKK